MSVYRHVGGAALPICHHAKKYSVGADHAGPSVVVTMAYCGECEVFWLVEETFDCVGVSVGADACEVTDDRGKSSES